MVKKTQQCKSQENQLNTHNFGDEQEKNQDEGAHDKPMVEPRRFWKKLSRFAQRAGREVLEKALILFYVSQSDHVPKRVKVMIVGALGYFISTIDAIPDITPMIGFADDLGILVAAVGAIAAWINPSIQAKVERKLKEYFHSYDNTDLTQKADVELDSELKDKNHSQTPPF